MYERGGGGRGRATALPENFPARHVRTSSRASPLPRAHERSTDRSRLRRPPTFRRRCRRRRCRRCFQRECQPGGENSGSSWRLRLAESSRPARGTRPFRRRAKCPWPTRAPRYRLCAVGAVPIWGRGTQLAADPPRLACCDGTSRAGDVRGGRCDCAAVAAVTTSLPPGAGSSLRCVCSNSPRCATTSRGLLGRAALLPG